MARLAKIEYSNQSQLDLELHERVMADKAAERYRKHYDFCAEVLGGMLDFATRVIEYRELTNRLVPQKLYREWSLLFVDGQPLFEVTQLPHKDPQEPTPEQILEEERQRLLDEGDFSEYRVTDTQFLSFRTIVVVVSCVFVLQQMIGEWQPLEEEEPIMIKTRRSQRRNSVQSCVQSDSTQPSPNSTK